MGRKLFVGNLPYTCTSEQLEETFRSFGNVVSAKVILDRETGRSRGFAFVEMETEEATQNAMRALDGSQYGGRALAVREAQERPDGGGPGGPRRGPGGPGGGDRGPRPFGGGGGGGGGGGRSFGGPGGGDRGPRPFGGGGRSFGGPRGGGGGYGRGGRDD